MASIGWARRTVFDSITVTEKRLILEYIDAKKSGGLRDFKNRFVNRYGYSRYKQIEKYSRILCK